MESLNPGVFVIRQIFAGMVDTLSTKERSELMSRIRSQNTKPELIVRSLVHRLGYRFRLHKRNLPGKPDLVLSRHKVVIFVNGCFWHWHSDPNCPFASMPKSNLDYWKPKLARTRERDQETIELLEAEGWRVMVVWECELREQTELILRIQDFLGKNRIN